MIVTQPSKYFSILKLKYDYPLLSLHTFLLYISLPSKNSEIIVIVGVMGRQNTELL